MKSIKTKLIHPLANKIIDLYSIPNSLFHLTPLVVRLRITNKCNLHCDYCFLKDSLNQGESDHLSIDEWDKIIKNLPPWTLFDITGAEAFLAKDFHLIMQKLIRKFKVSLITNGLKWNEKDIEYYIKNGLSYLMVSLDGTENYHNEIRGNKNSFENSIALLKFVKNFKEKNGLNNPVVSVKSTLTDDNVDDLIKLNKYLFDNKLVNIHSINLMFQNNARDQVTKFQEYEDVLNSSGNTFKYLNPKKSYEDALKLKHNSQGIIFKPNVENLKDYFMYPEKMESPHCKKFKSVVTLYYDGTLNVCDIGHKVGNIREIDYNFKRMWTFDKYKKFGYLFSKEKKRKACQACCLGKQVYVE